MRKKQVSALEFIEQVITKTIVQKEGKDLLPDNGVHCKFLINPIFYDS
jgi:hypothetical protein